MQDKFTRFALSERIDQEQIAREAPAIQAALEVQPLLDAVPNVLVVLNRFRQVIYSNQALLDILEIDDLSLLYGLRPGEFLQCSHAFESEGGCGTVEVCTTCGLMEAIQVSLNGLPAVRECRIVTRSGAGLDLRISTKPLRVNGEPCTVFSIVDISDEKRRGVLERIFLHDIHNAASLVVSYTDLFTSMESLSEDDRAFMLNQLTNIASRMIRDIDTQRIITAAESHTLTLSVSTLDAAQILVEVSSEYRRYMVDHKVSIVIEPFDNSIRFISDRSLIDRVIGNMVKNALEACSPGQVVTIGVRADSKTVTFVVHNPTFMPRKVQLQIFQRSYSTKGEGRGIGTYSIKLLSENYLQGRVWFESDEAAGTRFFVQYPLVINQGVDE